MNVPAVISTCHLASIAVQFARYSCKLPHIDPKAIPFKILFVYQFYWYVVTFLFIVILYFSVYILVNADICRIEHTFSSLKSEIIYSLCFVFRKSNSGLSTVLENYFSLTFKLCLLFDYAASSVFPSCFIQ